MKNYGRRRRRRVLTAAAIATAAFVVPSGAQAAGWSVFFLQNSGSCSWRGVSKTYYENGSSSSWVSARGEYWQSASGSSYYMLGGELTDYQSGAGAKEARVSKDVQGTAFQRLYSTHRGSPWGGAWNTDFASKGFYNC